VKRDPLSGGRESLRVFDKVSGWERLGKAREGPLLLPRCLLCFSPATDQSTLRPVARLASMTATTRGGQPFKWKFTTADLDDILYRLDRHERADTTNDAQPGQPDPLRTSDPHHKLKVLGGPAGFVHPMIASGALQGGPLLGFVGAGGIGGRLREEHGSSSGSHHYRRRALPGGCRVISRRAHGRQEQAGGAGADPTVQLSVQGDRGVDESQMGERLWEVSCGCFFWTPRSGAVGSLSRTRW
jgi:hypothetical protein